MGINLIDCLSDGWSESIKNERAPVFLTPTQINSSFSVDICMHIISYKLKWLIQACQSTHVFLLLVTFFLIQMAFLNRRSQCFPHDHEICQVRPIFRMSEEDLWTPQTDGDQETQKAVPKCVVFLNLLFLRLLFI